jgi:hypothetical protein
MATGTGTVYDGELTIYPSQSLTDVGSLFFRNVVAGHTCFQVKVTGFVSGHIDIDFGGSLTGNDDFGLVAAATKHAGAQRISANGTYLYFIQDKPVRDYVFYVTALTNAGPTVTVTLGALSDG